MKNKLNTQRLSLRNLASRKRVAPSSVASWVEAGCPRNKDKTFNEIEVDKWLAERREAVAEAKDLKQQKLEAEITRIKRDIESREIDLSKQRGEVHDKAACAASLTELRARESRVLHGLASRFLAAFPEQDKAAEWLGREIDGVIERLKQ